MAYGLKVSDCRMMRRLRVVWTDGLTLATVSQLNL